MRPIMILGTSSQAGKTTIVAGLCRYFANRGYSVAPFKSQNMSLNSYVTYHGEEIARSTAVQAVGAKQTPSVHMNPILLKPKSDHVSQMMIHGKPYADVSAKDYFATENYQSLKIESIRHSFNQLRKQHSLIIAEGAGSCAEPNLRDLDVVNMGLAELVDADVYLLVDIDKGGAFADIFGTWRVMELTRPSDLKRIKGFIINKFRGDREVLQSALDFTEKHLKVPIISVLPYLHNLQLEEEDRIKNYFCANPEIDVALLYLPHISNSTDFDGLAAEDNVQVRFVKSVHELGAPDLVIIPGTKNTIGDLDYLRKSGWESVLKNLSAKKIPLMGICGGFQMLGNFLHDREKVESDLGSVEGLHLLDFDVTFGKEKTVLQRKYKPTENNVWREAGDVEGYEIHCGQVNYGNCMPLYKFDGGFDGGIDKGKMVFGTFIHGIFGNGKFTRSLINLLREKKRLPLIKSEIKKCNDRFDAEYERLADVLSEVGALIERGFHEK